MILARLVKRNRPKSYKARDAAYAVGGNPGVVLAMYPRPYPKSAPQRVISALAKTCKITSGISKSDLQMHMKDCLTPANWDEEAKKLGVTRKK